MLVWGKSTDTEVTFSLRVGECVLPTAGGGSSEGASILLEEETLTGPGAVL